MSCREITYKGYGVVIPQNLSEETFKTFVKSHKKEIDAIGLWSMAELLNIDDFLVQVEIICDIINKKTGLYFYYIFGEDDTVIIYEPMYPWEMKITDISLTVEKLDELLAPFVAELGLSEPDYQEVSTWG